MRCTGLLAYCSKKQFTRRSAHAVKAATPAFKGGCAGTTCTGIHLCSATFGATFSSSRDGCSEACTSDAVCGIHITTGCLTLQTWQRIALRAYFFCGPLAHHAFHNLHKQGSGQQGQGLMLADAGLWVCSYISQEEGPEILLHCPWGTNVFLCIPMAPCIPILLSLLSHRD